MDQVHDTIAWYQQKIGSYDKQLWEQSVEQKVLGGIRHAPRRSVRPKTVLIDVDLVRGSTFTKAKPQVRWTYITLKTFSRVLLFPFYYKWWLSQLSFWTWCLMLVLYSLQVFTTFVFFRNVGDCLTQDEQSLSEVVIPCVLMVLLGLIHSQTILTHFSLKPPVRDSKRDGWKRKRLISSHHGSGGSTDGVAPTASKGDLTGRSQSKPKVKGQHGSRLHGHTGSHVTRHRDHKGRHKTNNPHAARRSNMVQDSESAYHTHEASDSVQDKTSSHEQDSNGHDHSNTSTCSQHPEVTKSVTACLDEPRKTRESMESDIPESQASDSENEDVTIKLRKKDPYKDPLQNVKRYSHSLSSDVEMIEESPPKFNKIPACENMDMDIKLRALDDPGTKHKPDNKEKLEIKTAFEGRSVSTSSPEIVQCDTKATSLADFGCTPPKPTGDKVQPNTSTSKVEDGFEVFSDGSCIDVCLSGALSSTTVNEKEDIKGASNQELDSENSKTTTESNGTIKTAASEDNISDKLNIKFHSASSVHFTVDKELVRLQEIMPLGSREGTPTHTQSDIMLQNKHAVTQRSNIRAKSESDLESDKEKSYTSIPNVRRRKVLQDKNEGNGSVLRNRRQSFQTFRKKNDAVSSSDGETEPAKSAYGGHKSAVSSEEWEDHIQSDVDTSSCSSSCGSEPEISGNEEPERASDSEAKSNCINLQGMTASNVHVINLLQPSASQTSTHGAPDKVTCIIWEGNECKKVELTAMDIGWAIIDKVDKIPESSDYILIGFAFSVLMGLTPLMFRAFYSIELPNLYGWDGFEDLWRLLKQNSWRLNLVITNAGVQRWFLSLVFFFLLSVADRTFKQRLLYAKHFCYLTSSRRSRKFDMPHFRLNKVRNIKIWLSLRSYLKKRGPQRSVDVIVSSCFLVTLIMLIFMCLQLLRDAETYLNYLCNWELLVWCLALGVYLLRFMTLGLRINKKYRNLSVLITEQINLYLQMEQKPHKKEELMVANNVLKLAESLLKELESPFKISGISANPFVLNVTKVVVLSAFSAVLTELLGFKLKLYKIKLKA